MARHRGKRAYTSRREKREKSFREIRIVLLFAGIALAIYLFMNRVFIWDYIRTSFY